MPETIGASAAAVRTYKKAGELQQVGNRRVVKRCRSFAFCGRKDSVIRFGAKVFCFDFWITAFLRVNKERADALKICSDIACSNEFSIFFLTPDVHNDK